VIGLIWPIRKVRLIEKFLSSLWFSWEMMEMFLAITYEKYNLSSLSSQIGLVLRRFLAI